MAGKGAAAARQGILSLNLKEAAEVHRHYMSFAQGGGLFVPTTKKYRLGDEVFLLVMLHTEDGNERLPVPGKVCWITPLGAQGSRKAGIGVAFGKSSEGNEARKKIESVLAAHGHAEQPTMTM